MDVVGGVRVSPTGQVWVKRQTAFGATEDVFDVFDAAGARVRRFAVPAGSTLVGFGPQSVYMRTDTAGGEVLRRYRLQ